MLLDLTPSGSFDPVQLAAYLIDARATGKSIQEVAADLSIEPHRAIYALNDGFDIIQRRAQEEGTT